VVNQYTVDLGELQFVTVVCPECKTELTVDLEYDDNRNRHVPTARNPVVPSRCLTCNAIVDSQIILGLNQLREAYLSIKGKDGAIVQFTIREHEATTPQPSPQSPKPERRPQRPSRG
jgi:uncharacterized protein YbaR (Trm112 family)